jgi:hypothetical protein
MIVLKPPAPLDLPADRAAVFLAGSIEMGAAEDWQAVITAHLADLPVVILNPRRDDWDPTWRQSIDDDRFRGQVEWELEGLDRAAIIAMWFAPGTKAPVTLLELGLNASSGKVIVGCPDGFWRKGNVEIVCQRSGIPLHGGFEGFVAAVRARVASALGA